MAGYTPPAPKFLGARGFDDYDLGELARYIDWTPFFQTWELVGQYPAILTDDKVGKAARDLFADAQKMLEKIVDEKWLTARAVFGFWPGQRACDDDILVYRRQGAQISHRHAAYAAPADGARGGPAQSGAGRFHRARRARPIISAALSSPPVIGEETHIKRFEAAKDDYSAILLRALADRLGGSLCRAPA